MDLFNYLVVELFDPWKRLKWESSTCNSFDPTNNGALTNFVTKQIFTLNAAKPKITNKTSGELSRTAKTHFAKCGTDSTQCTLCKRKHTLMLCSEFKFKPAIMRKSIVETSCVCYNCLGNYLITKYQSQKNCLICKIGIIRCSKTRTLYQSPLRSVHSMQCILLTTARRSSRPREQLKPTIGNSYEVRVLIDPRCQSSQKF